MTDRKNFFDQPARHKSKTFDSIQKIATAQGNDYTTCCLLDYYDF